MANLSRFRLIGILTWVVCAAKAGAKASYAVEYRSLGHSKQVTVGHLSRTARLLQECIGVSQGGCLSVLLLMLLLAVSVGEQLLILLIAKCFVS